MITTRVRAVCSALIGRHDACSTERTRRNALERKLRMINESRTALKQDFRKFRAESRAHNDALEQTLSAVRKTASRLKAHLRVLPVEADASVFRDRRLSWLHVVDQPLALVSQIPRSGGTLLSQLLDGHPSVHAFPYELKWGKRFPWPDVDLEADPYTLFTMLDHNWISSAIMRGAFTKSRLTPRDNEGRAGLPFIFDRLLQYRIFRRRLETIPPASRRDVLNTHLTAFFNAWLDYQSQYCGPKRVVTAFSPHVLGHPDSLDRYMTDYPDGWLVSLVRHPAAWHASMLRTGAARNDASAADLDRWIAATTTTLGARESYGNRVLILVFEDLVRDTAAVMRRVAAHLGLPWSPTLQQPTFNGMPVHSNSHFAATTRVDPAVTDRYRTVLSPAAVAAIEARTLPLYEQVCAEFGLETSAA